MQFLPNEPATKTNEGSSDAYLAKTKLENGYRDGLRVSNDEWILQKRLGRHILNNKFLMRLFSEPDSQRSRSFVGYWNELCQLYPALPFAFYEKIENLFNSKRAQNFLDRLAFLVYSNGFHDMVINSYPNDAKSLITLLSSLPYRELADPVLDSFHQLGLEGRLDSLSKDDIAHARDRTFRLFLETISYGCCGQNWHGRSLPNSDSFRLFFTHPLLFLRQIQHFSIFIQTVS